MKPEQACVPSLRELELEAEAEARVAATYVQGGRPAARVGVLLLRVMVLQHLYGLSDPQAEIQINDRLSFQKFLQLDTHEAVPDKTTLCRFRQRLIECGLHEPLPALLNTQLEARGHLVKRTTLVDATLVESSRQRPSAEAASSGQAPDADTRAVYAARRMTARPTGRGCGRTASPTAYSRRRRITSTSRRETRRTTAGKEKCGGILSASSRT